MSIGKSSNKEKHLNMKRVDLKYRWFISSIIILLFFQESFGANSPTALLETKEVVRELKPFNFPTSNTVKLRYIEIGVGLGANQVGSAPDGLKSKGGTVLNIGVNYNQSLNEDWGIVTGLELSMGTAKLSANDYSGKGNYVDMEEEHFIFNYSTSRFTETWKTTRLGIPIMAEYKGIMDGKIYVRGGFKYSFKLSNTIDLKADNLETSGYFPEYDVEFTEPKFAGFGSFGDFKEKKTGEGKGRFSLVFEAGTKFKLPNFDALHVALYFDLGLGNEGYSSSNKQGVVGYRPVYNEAIELNSIYETQRNSKKFKTSNFGVKLTYSFDFL